jgi:hypothetical protein
MSRAHCIEQVHELALLRTREHGDRRVIGGVHRGINVLEHRQST